MMARTSRTKLSVAECRRLARRRALQIFASVLTGFAVLFAILYLSDRTIGVEPEKLVAVYHTHGCPCVHQWERSLEGGGFTVIMYEPETLGMVRAKLHMPKALRGCHVGEFLGYFLEGHISPSVLERIAKTRPRGAGFVTAVTFTADTANISIADEESSPILLIDAQGHRTAFADAATKLVR